MPRDFNPVGRAPLPDAANIWMLPTDPGDDAALCQFMSGDPGDGDVGKCGLPVVRRSAYCARHHRDCVRPSMPYRLLLRLAGLAER